MALPVTAILGATLMRYGWPSTLSIHGGLHWASGGWLRFTTDFGHSEEIALNIILFVPAGLVLALVLRRPLLIFVLLSGLSATIELVQGALGLGTADLSDFLSNTIGAGCGTIAGGAIACVWGSRERRPYAQVGILLGTAVVLAALVPLGAAHRQGHVEKALEARFAGLTFDDYQRWSSDGQIGRRVFTVGGIFSSGAEQHDGRAVVRYPTSFMGIDQCLIATWTRIGVTITRHHESLCDEFMG
ncbi:MAG: VanZ family protein [Nocardioides sp.]|uniref:VanZ family protein n=1 Tax=Nocardioides sp. TaxID=35761 RepID=UPI0039E2ECAA